MRRLAIRSALSAKVADGELQGRRAASSVDAPKTKAVAGLLEALDFDRSVLLVTGAPDRNLLLSARNLPGAKALPADYLNVADLLAHRGLVMTVEAVRRAEALWGGERATKRARARCRRRAAWISTMNPYAVILRPLVTEKSTALAGANKYIFEVDMRANKPQIKNAVEKAFNVTVTDVNIMVMKGKPRGGRRCGRKIDARHRLEEGRRHLDAERQNRTVRGRVAMPIKQFKPTSPGRRGASGYTFAEITKTKPEKSLTVSKKQSVRAATTGA